MITITINGNEITSMDKLHEYIGKAITLPPYYGKNLDALHDVLTENDCRITIINHEALRQSLGNAGDAVIRLLDDINAESENRESTGEDF